MKPFTVTPIKNGDMVYNFTTYKCECCDDDVPESAPHYVDESGVYCGDCAFKLCLISEEEYIHDFLYFCPVERAVVHNGEIHIASSKRHIFPWEREPDRQRHTLEYVEWRKSVFERDHYTCAICGQVGGELNAHHIRPFATHEELRFDIDNGITLCKECHKKVHKEKDERWLKDECSQKK